MSVKRLGFAQSAPRPGICPGCLAVVIKGISMGLDTTLEPTPLTLAGQVHAMESGREIWDLEIASIGGRKNAYIAIRDIWRIKAGRNAITLGTHICGQFLDQFADLAAAQQLAEFFRPRHRSPGSYGPPPF